MARKQVGIFSLGFTRGLIGLLIASPLGIALVSVVRAALGLKWYEPFDGWLKGSFWFSEPAWVMGALFGAVGFLIGLGAFSDWWKVAMGQDVADVPASDPLLPGWARYWNFTTDHKVIGVQYVVLALLMFNIAGLFALIFRTELLTATIDFIDPTLYNTFMSLHGIVMIMSILVGIAGIMNYLVPLMIGANDMAFPRLNAFAFWINVPSAIMLMSSLALGGFDTGWVGYPPLSVRAPLGIQMFFLGVYLFGLSSIFGALNIIVTIIRCRAPGMTPFKMPIFVWSALATSMISLTGTQLIALSFQMVMFQRLFGMGFFDPAKGGDVILFQHLFWFYSHPAVYVFVLPGLGLISEMLPVFVRKPLFGYKWVALSSIAIALVGFFVWAHHMFTSGMQEFLRVPFMYSTLLVAVPTGIKFFSWMGTLWGGKMTFQTPMLFILGSIAVFLIGGLSGPPNGTVSTDLHLHDTYFVVGHFHATMFGGFVFPFMAAIYFWYPKLTGRMYNERLGQVHFWLIFPGFMIQSFGQMFVGLMGMRRRIAGYDEGLGIENENVWITIAGFAIGLSVLIFLFNLAYSARRGPVAEANPWRSRSPEWLLPTPIPEHNYAQPPQVIGEPYDYGLEGSTYVKLPAEPVHTH
ncbi:MAG: cytochrome c oxidase subunit I [Chloroflexota bacterium]